MKSTKINFIFNSLYQLTAIIVPLITFPYLSRTVGVDGIGDYSFAYSVAYYFAIFIKLGLNTYGNRTIAYVRNSKDMLSRTFWSLYFFQFIMAVVLLSVYLIYCTMFALQKGLAFLLIFFVISSGMDITWMFYGLEEFRIIAIRDIFVKITTMLAVFAFVKNSNDIWKYTLILSIGYLLMQVSVWPLLVKYVYWVIPKKSEIIEHIKPNLILFVPTIAVSIYKIMDKIMLGAMISYKEVGYYHSSESIMQVPMALITSLGTVMLPRVSNMFSVGTSKKVMSSIFGHSIEFAMFLASSMCMGIMTVAQEFVPLFYGKGFDKCVILYYYLMPSCIFLAFANVIRTQYLIPKKKDFDFVLSLLIGAMVNLIINILLIPHFLSIGAAIGTLLAEASVCIVQTMVVRKEIPIISYFWNSVPYIVSGIIMFLCFRNYSM